MSLQKNENEVVLRILYILLFCTFSFPLLFILFFDIDKNLETFAFFMLLIMISSSFIILQMIINRTTREERISGYLMVILSVLIVVSTASQIKKIVNYAIRKSDHTIVESGKTNSNSDNISLVNQINNSLKAGYRVSINGQWADEEAISAEILEEFGSVLIDDQKKIIYVVIK